MIRRGIKPNIFEIYQNGEMINQSSSVKDYQAYIEQNILKLNYRSFTQIVVLGSSNFVPFMQLPAAQRREIIEDLLDIRVFSFMNNLLKDRMAVNGERIIQAESELFRAKDRFDLKSNFVESLKKDREKSLSDITQKKVALVKDIDTFNKEKSLLLKKHDDLAAKTQEFAGVSDRLNELTRLESGIKVRLKDANTNVQFWTDNNNCPTCEQEIAPDVKAKNLKAAQYELIEYGSGLETLREEFAKVQDKLNRQTALNSDLIDLQHRINETSAKLDMSMNLMETLKREHEEKHQSNRGDLRKEKAELTKMANEIRDCLARKKDHINKREILNVAHELLKDDGIKSQIIRQYMPVINQLINKYLAALDFFVDFQLDENFTESIKSRYRDEFSYDNFSEGEKLRIDLSLLLAWRSIAKLKNSINTNVIILDEVLDASLDLSGCDDFIKLLQELATDTNVFVISHKGDVLVDKFNRTLKFEKVRNFSQMVEQ